MDKKELAILTIVDNTNIGNRLQNFALQEFLKQFNCNVITLPHFYPNNDVLIKNVKENTSNNFLEFLTKKIFNQFKKLYNIKLNFRKLYKFKRFKDFSSTYINQYESIQLKKKTLEEISEDFDYFIVGSDQIWNPFYRFGNSYDFLQFTSFKKRIAYSPSFGISEIPKKYIASYTKYLSEFNHISVREFDGKKIVNELTRRDVDVLLDPTLLFDKSFWNKIKTPHKMKPKKKYILTYFLGKKSTDLNDFLKKINSKNQFEIVDLGDIQSDLYYDTNPSEFLDFVHDASLILTDSYHGTIFSIIYRKPFIIFDRIDQGPDINSRFKTLFYFFNFENRRLVFIDIKDIFTCDFSIFESKIDSLISKSKDYFKNIFKD